MTTLSDHHINVLVEHKVFQFPVFCTGQDGYGQSMWVYGQRGGSREPIKDWCNDPELAASLVERYVRRGRSVGGPTPKDVCINALRAEGLEI